MSKKKQKGKESQDRKTVDENLNTTDKSNLSDDKEEIDLFSLKFTSYF